MTYVLLIDAVGGCIVCRDHPLMLYQINRYKWESFLFRRLAITGHASIHLSLYLAELSSSSCRVPKHSQTRWSGPVFPPSLAYPEYLNREAYFTDARTTLTASFWCKRAMVHLPALSSSNISKGESSHPAKETHFGCLIRSILPRLRNETEISELLRLFSGIRQSLRKS